MHLGNHKGFSAFVSGIAKDDALAGPQFDGKWEPINKCGGVWIRKLMNCYCCMACIGSCSVDNF